MNDLSNLNSEKPALRAAKRILEKKGWLSTRPKSFRQLLLPNGHLRHYKAGDTIYRLGEEANGIFGLMDGQVYVSIPNDAGSVIDCYMGNPGVWIGDLALFSKATRLVTVTAETDVTIWFLPQARMMDLLRSRPDFMPHFYALSHINTALILRILANLAIPEGDRRLAAWLLFSDDGLAEPGGWIVGSQEQIAMMNAMSLPTARRVLKRFSDLHLIEPGYGRLRILNRTGLADYCTH